MSALGLAENAFHPAWRYRGRRFSISDGARSCMTLTSSSECLVEWVSSSVEHMWPKTTATMKPAAIQTRASSTAVIRKLASSDAFQFYSIICWLIAL